VDFWFSPPASSNPHSLFLSFAFLCSQGSWTLSPLPRFLLRPSRTKRRAATTKKPLSTFRVSSIRSLPFFFELKASALRFFLLRAGSLASFLFLSSPWLPFTQLTDFNSSLPFPYLQPPLFASLLLSRVFPSCFLSFDLTETSSEDLSKDNGKLSLLDKLKVKTDWLEEKVVSSDFARMGGKEKEGESGGHAWARLQKTRQESHELTFFSLLLLVIARRVWNLEESSEFLILLRGPIWLLATTRPFGEL